MSRVARSVESFEDSDSYARFFACKTGPALGLLLDRYAPGWRDGAASTPMDALLIAALQITTPPDLKSAVEQRAQAYGYGAVRAAEDERDQRHQEFLSELTTKFLQGPVLQFPDAPELNRSFNPNELVPFPSHGVYYPTGTFTANWGKLTVESGGALLAPDNRSVRVPAPTDLTARPLHGEGWTLELAPGWTVRAAGSPGSFALAPSDAK